MRITTSQGHFAIDQDQRQRLGARSPQKTFYDRVFGKSHRLLRQVKTFNLPPQAFQPIDVGGKSDFFLVNIHTANTGAATEGGRGRKLEFWSCRSPFCH